MPVRSRAFATSSNPTIGFEFRLADWLFSTCLSFPSFLHRLPFSSATLLRTPTHRNDYFACNCLNERCSRYAHP